MQRKNDFNVNIKSIHEDCSPSHKEEITKKTQKLSKYFSHIIDANVILDKQNPLFRVEMLVQVPGLVISAKDEDYDRTKAFDSTYEKVKSQIKKLKSKVSDHRIPQPEDIEPVILEDFEEDEEYI